MSTAVNVATSKEIRTSRVGRKPVKVLAGVEVKINDQQFAVKGPKGQLSVPLHPFVQVTMESNEILVKPSSKNKKKVTGKNVKLDKSIVGTIRSIIHNAIHGVAHGFERKLILVGVGYRAQCKGKVLSLSLGFSHPTEFSVPEGITVETPTQTEILIKGADKELVGLVASKIRSIRGPEPYKGKGVRYANETIELKETKKK